MVLSNLNLPFVHRIHRIHRDHRISSFFFFYVFIRVKEISDSKSCTKLHLTQAAALMMIPNISPTTTKQQAGPYQTTAARVA